MEAQTKAGDLFCKLVWSSPPSTGAPDPFTPHPQVVCSIGGNVAENSGGAHCLRYGFTVNHGLAVRLALADGTVVDVGGPAPDAPGYDLLAAVVGSEGLLGVVTEATVRLLGRPEATRTFLAIFPSTEEAGRAVWTCSPGADAPCGQTSGRLSPVPSGPRFAMLLQRDIRCWAGDRSTRRPRSFRLPPHPPTSRIR